MELQSVKEGLGGAPFFLKLKNLTSISASVELAGRIFFKQKLARSDEAWNCHSRIEGSDTRTGEWSPASSRLGSDRT
jgi:hypothetical protein